MRRPRLQEMPHAPRRVCLWLALASLCIALASARDTSAHELHGDGGRGEQAEAVEVHAGGNTGYLIDDYRDDSWADAADAADVDGNFDGNNADDGVDEGAAGFSMPFSRPGEDGKTGLREQRFLKVCGCTCAVPCCAVA